MLSLRENTRTEIAFKSLDDQPGIAEDTRSEVAEVEVFVSRASVLQVLPPSKDRLK